MKFMDDSIVSDLLDRKKQKAKQASKDSDRFYQFCAPGAEQMVTFRIADKSEHLALFYGHLHLCYFISNSTNGDTLRLDFEGGWRVYIYGRGLEAIHRALVSRALLWIRAAGMGEADNNQGDVFVKSIRTIGPSVKNHKEKGKESTDSR